MKCPHCQAPRLTTTEFRKEFKVGDIIQGWSTGKKVMITAIGEERFLYKNADGYHRNKEYVSTIRATWLWKKAQE